MSEAKGFIQFQVHRSQALSIICEWVVLGVHKQLCRSEQFVSVYSGGKNRSRSHSAHSSKGVDERPLQKTEAFSRRMFFRPEGSLSYGEYQTVEKKISGHQVFKIELLLDRYLI
ncbi:hypothetical protein CEXT_760371 [Caerostris extrusa]|uniref:Uncharacterized protein n=1 Tax=Caerostris extrusa TaxID=172846 RepID=A0AAV4TBE2_CAEEX|nr:hypothetical protein CEXT_760371 [Caerostris extrusa]